MNTCNYTTPYPIASHEEGGVLYSNGVQVVTILPLPMNNHDSVWSPLIVVIALFVAVIAVVIALFNYLFDRK